MTLENFADPASVTDREDVAFSEGTTILHQDGFERWEPLDGLVALGVTTDDGAILLMVFDDDLGWSLPASAVAPGEDYAAVGRQLIEEQTNVALDIEQPELVRRNNFVLEDDNERHTTAYHTILRTECVTDEIVAEDLITDVSEDILDIGWFDAVPDDAAPNVEDDIRLFVE